MINLFMRARHWQIFLATFGLAFVLEIILIANIFASLMEKPDVRVIFGYLKFLPLIIGLSTGTLFAWQWSVVMGLQKMLPAGVKLKLTQFKIFFFVPIIYFTLVFTFILTVFGHFINSVMLHNSPPDPSIFVFFPIIFPLHLFSIFCLFYCIYFAAKTMKTVELQREVVFSDFIGEFFLFWFHFVGVWILQPRINKLIAQYQERGQNDEAAES
ncbi:MAG: hypothetical protein ACXVI9_12145 [Mucilaginibacter sp.]